MSQLSKSLQAMYSEKDMQDINSYLSSFVANKYELCKCMLNNNVLTVRDIAEHLNFSPEISQEIISKLLKANMISKKFQNSYIKNKHFTDWLKQQVLDARK
jgi:Mn-dependent DtxR family transcriptional regulator